MIYLLHSDKELGSGRYGTATHYLGYCQEGNLWNRMGDHYSGKSNVPIVRAFQEDGGTLYLVRIWPDGGRALERQLKRTAHFKERCPVCQGWLALDRAVPIATASQLLPTFDGRPSARPMLTQLRSVLNGRQASTDGLYSQLLIQAPLMWSERVGGVTLGTPGGPVSTVVVLMKGLAVRSVGTRRQLSVAGRTTAYGVSQENRVKRHMDQVGKLLETKQLPLRLVDGEGFET